MKKIIAAFDGLKFSESTKEYAITLAKSSNAHLTGVFLDDITYTSYKIYELVGKEGVSVEKQNILDKKDEQKRKLSEKNFDQACQQNGLNYSVHHDHKIAIRELLHETIYSDLLLIDANETLTHYEEEPPTRFVHRLLTETHCPVLLVPEKYRPVEKIILLYDGEPSSVYAIKMFSYLLHSLKHLPAEVLSVKTINQTLHLPDNKLMREFMKRHYPDADYTVLKGEARSKIPFYLKSQHENILVVLRAYHRGTISRMIDESMADILMKDLKVPLFIA